MADKPQTQSKQYEELSRRLAKLEAAISPGGTGSPYTATGNGKGTSNMGACSLVKVPDRTFAPEVSQFREELIRYIGKKWVNGTKLKYYFFEDGPFKV